MASDCNLVVKEQQAFKFLKKKVFNFWYPALQKRAAAAALCVCCGWVCLG